jgi:hypothetical protein
MKTQYIKWDGTNRCLKRFYRAFNRAHFGNTLDTETQVRFSRRPTRSNNAWYDQEYEEIVIDRRFKGQGRIAIWLLLHEMNHMVSGPRHKRKFDKGMLRLAIAGAFKGIW